MYCKPYRYQCNSSKAKFNFTSLDLVHRYPLYFIAETALIASVYLSKLAELAEDDFEEELKEDFDSHAK